MGAPPQARDSRWKSIVQIQLSLVAIWVPPEVAVGAGGRVGNGMPSPPSPSWPARWCPWAGGATGVVAWGSWECHHRGHTVDR